MRAGLTLAVILAGALMRQNRFTTWVSGGSPVDWFIPTQGAGALWWRTPTIPVRSSLES